MSIKRLFMMLGVVIGLAGLTILAAFGMGATDNAARTTMIGGMVAVVVVFFLSRR